ncbi:methylated-DNA--[protein]-cysteine S-methyltransferase [Oceanotoga sp. DSM 15011]|jgi:methylated-DNA-[protein]-cysteine S-methyltransferase|uniref:methylated-DNA--[protein]-cysteine S-methyltransferase n=1 Tax=Oceanotoga sp. DSM 15011 TaxID=2984951 RepID=UPI0021F3CEC0|nr:methylated-DNA--[protein]-cysteine S-methyltransferase [Oceanotoga sp. DSM 15011]UYO99728.1 methylated-DNA--[protein]-cysteine S-methyltransferase [Oceanotoga sp. DSM 15011]
MVNMFLYHNDINDLYIFEENNKIINISYGPMNIEYIEKETDLIKETYKQIKEYMNGKRRNFEIPLQTKGTVFQNKVWEELKKIPYGKTVSYKYIAEKINNPKAYRAVGMANNRNPISIIIPCHRVIGEDGSLVGYGGGLHIKRELLKIEGILI